MNSNTTARESKIEKSWFVFDPEREFARQGITDKWRVSTLNQDYQFAPTYPGSFGVPSKIGDSTLRHIGKFRSKCRIPALSYFHRTTHTSITRCSQPMVGLKQNKSIQDEKLIEAIFGATETDMHPLTPGQSHLIIDARPTANALAQTAMGGGTESSDTYKGSRIVFLGIDNIHVVRDSQNKLIDALQTINEGNIPRSLLDKSGWLKHIRNIIDGTLLITQHISCYNANVLVHCSDGWDRTAQLCSLSCLCLDPYFRTVEGFQVLVEKEWCAFGFKFADRCGHLSKPSGDLSGEDTGAGAAVASSSSSSSSTSTANSMRDKLEIGGKNVSKMFSSGMKSFLGKMGTTSSSSESLSPSSTSYPFTSNLSSSSTTTGPVSAMSSSTTSEISKVKSLAPREVSPIFTQFLDCVYQLWTQFPTHFEFNEKFLISLNTHIYSGQFGTFLFNCERERRTYSYKPTFSSVSAVAGCTSLQESTCSAWDWFNDNRNEFLNPLYMPNRSGGSGGGVGAGGSDLSSAATANIVGQGVGHVGDVLGAAGTMSPDGSVLYPSSSNLKYWASLFLRTDDELNSDFATTGGGGGGVSKSNSSSAAEGSVGTSDSLAAVGEMVEERIGWAVRAATSLFNGNNNNSSSDLLNAAATVGATTAETSSNLDFQMQSSTQMSSLNDEEEEDGAANVFKLTSSNESIDKLSPPAPLPAAASVAAPPAVIPSSINPWASSSRTATTTVASSTDLDVGMRMANITLEEPTSKRVITFPPSQPPPATSSSAAPHPLWDPLS